MKKVLLINTNMEKAPYPVPPLGLCMLAAVLKDRYEVKIHDGVFDEGRTIIAVIQQFNPDFIGCSIRNIDDVVEERSIFYVDAILKNFVGPIRETSQSPVILGGSGFSIFPVELMKLTGADYGIVGEAEIILPELLNRIQQHANLSDLPNLITRDLPQVQKGACFSFLKPVPGRFPEIDRWIDFTPYLAKGVYSIQTKRGCSHGCIYCTYPWIEGRKFRPRTASDIADEIEQSHRRLGNVTFEFVDSTFNDPKGHAEAICREIIARKVKVRLRTMGINPRHTSAELFELMMEAGFVQIDATPDSASPRLLKNLDKGFMLEDIEKMALLIKKINLPTMWFFLFGGPGEDETSFRETLEFIDSYVNPLDLVYMNSGLRIYPNTPLYRIALEEGQIEPGQSVFHPPAYYHSQLITKNALEGLIKQASLKRYNCLPANETTPAPAMLAEAMDMKRSQQLNEPMFRTLLRIRSAWKAAGKM